MLINPILQTLSKRQRGLIVRKNIERSRGCRGGLTYSTIPKYRNILKIKHKLVNCKESAVSGYSYSSFIFIQFVLSLVFMDITAVFLSLFLDFISW